MALGPWECRKGGFGDAPGVSWQKSLSPHCEPGPVPGVGHHNLHLELHDSLRTVLATSFLYRWDNLMANEPRILARSDSSIIWSHRGEDPGVDHTGVGN